MTKRERKLIFLFFAILIGYGISRLVFGDGYYRYLDFELGGFHVRFVQGLIMCFLYFLLSRVFREK